MPQKQAGIRLVENLMVVSWGIQLTETGIRSGTVQSLIHGKSFGRKYPKNNEILKKEE
jgi:hypothetical protein